MNNILAIALVFITSIQLSNAQVDIRKATFAGGCFWCMEAPFDKIKGVLSTTSGYIGGNTSAPTYKSVSAGATGHTEAVQVLFDANKTSYKILLEAFWRNIDPTDNQGQFVDRGSQYRPGVFFHDQSQKALAEASKKDLDKSGRFKKKVVVEITSASTFYQAEEYHQNFYKKSPIRYKFYRFNSGRDQFLNKYWKSE